jgi:hypothetical protein
MPEEKSIVTAPAPEEPESETPSRALVPQVIPREAAYSLVPRSYAELEHLSLQLSESGLIPKELRGKPGDIIVAMETLRTIGLNPIAGLQGAFVVNGRVSIFGEWWLGLIQGSPVYNGHTEEWDEDTKTATVSFRRKGVPEPFVGTFSWADAVAAKLASKDLYQQYPKDMLTWRARHRAGSAAFADILHGIIPSEIAEDFTVIEAPARTVAMPARKSEAAATEATASSPAAPEPAEPVEPKASKEPAPPAAPPAAPAPAPSGPTALTKQTILKAASISLPKSKGGGAYYEITFGNEKVFRSKDPAIYRAAAAAEEGGYPVDTLTVGDTVTLITKAK